MSTAAPKRVRVKSALTRIANSFKRKETNKSGEADDNQVNGAEREGTIQRNKEVEKHQNDSNCEEDRDEELIDEKSGQTRQRRRLVRKKTLTQLPHRIRHLFRTSSNEGRARGKEEQSDINIQVVENQQAGNPQQEEWEEEEERDERDEDKALKDEEDTVQQLPYQEASASSLNMGDSKGKEKEQLNLPHSPPSASTIATPIKTKRNSRSLSFPSWLFNSEACPSIQTHHKPAMMRLSKHH